jgi:hypothetical protein
MDVVKFLESETAFDFVATMLATKHKVDLVELTTKIKTESKEETPWDGEVEIDGFIAGGAVANLLNEFVNHVPAVVRDIDVFHLYNRKPNIVHNVDGDLFDREYIQDGWVESDMEDFRQAFESELTVDGDWYGNKWVQPNGDFCLMKSHFRQGIANYVEVHVGTQKKVKNMRKLKQLIILRGFDINACQVGIDVKNKKVIYTDDFVEFLKSRQMKVTIPVNPIQTTIRLLKKMKDLQCYCDINNEVKLLQYACFCLDNISNRFGSETYEKYLEHKDQLDKVFEIIKIEKPEKTFARQQPLEDPFRMRPSYDGIGNGFHVEGKELWLFAPKLNSYDLDYYFNHPLSLINYWRMNEDSVSQVKKRKIKKITDYLYSKGVGKYNEDTPRYGRRDGDEYVYEVPLADMLGGRNSIRKYDAHGLHSYGSVAHKLVYRVDHWLWHNLVSHENYFDCDFHESHIEYIDNFMNDHRGLRWLFDATLSLYNEDELPGSHSAGTTSIDGTLQGQYNKIRVIKSISNKRGEWIVGELENLQYDKRQKLVQSEDLGKFINDYLDEREKELSLPLVEKLDLSGFEYVDCVTEINTTKDLKSEGTRMGHCVGGYSSAIKDGRSRIFHIECDGIGSTLEVGVTSDSIWPRLDIGNMREISDSWKEHIDRSRLRRLETLDRQLENTKFSIKQHRGRYPEKGNLNPTETNKEIAKKLVEFITESGTFLEDRIKDILYKRHQMEMEIRKEVWEKEQHKLETNPNGTITVQTFDDADQNLNQHYIPARRNVPIDEIF